MEKLAFKTHAKSPAAHHSSAVIDCSERSLTVASRAPSIVFWMRGMSRDEPMGTLSSATGWCATAVGARGLLGALRSTFFFGAWMLFGGAADSNWK